jgi:hypothetical protein
VRGDSATLEEDLDGGSRKANIKFFMDQWVRNAVVVVVDLDVVIDINPGPFPFGINIRMNREGFQNRFFEGFEEELSGPFELLKGTVIQSFEFFCDGPLELTEAEEGPVSQRSQDPMLYLKHARFDLGLVLGLDHPGRNDDGPVMLCEFPIGGIEVRFITAGACHGGFEIVRNENLGDSAKELKRMDMGLNPGRKLLGAGGFGEGIIAGSQGRHKNLDLSDLPGLRIRDLHGLPRIVDKEFLSGPIVLTETEIQFLDPLRVVVAEPTILVTIGIGFLVLVPQELKGYTLFLHLLIKVLHGRHLMLLLSDTSK